jgi:uncharacterized membrane protein YfcA
MPTRWRHPAHRIVGARLMWWLIATIGAGVGFVAGLFGAGGSAVGTPLLNAAGVPAFYALASPLPVAIPLAAAASIAYWDSGFIDRQLLIKTLWFAMPATVVGALITPLIGGGPLITLTEVLVVLIGVRFILRPGLTARPGERFDPPLARIAIVAIGVGLIAGLLGNSGGFLLAPLFVVILRTPLKVGLGTSLAISAVLAIPATITHAALGHIDWHVAAVYGVTAVPAAYVGARVALRVPSIRLARVYGAFLAVLGVVLLVVQH